MLLTAQQNKIDSEVQISNQFYNKQIQIFVITQLHQIIQTEVMEV